MRLKTRDRIGMKMFRAVYSEPVERTRANIRGTRKITALLSIERVKCALRRFFRALLQNKIDLLGFWRPDAKVRFVRADQFRADRITSFDLHITLSLLRCGVALHRRDLSFHFSRKNNMRTPAK
jgi:hypothetical protein